MEKTNDIICTIMNNGQEHSLHKCHNLNYEKAKYLFSLFDDNNCENTDDLIIEFADKNCDFMIHGYIANVYETTADAFMLSVIFNKKNVISKLLNTNEDKMNKIYTFGLGLTTTPREMLREFDMLTSK